VSLCNALSTLLRSHIIMDLLMRMADGDGLGNIVDIGIKQHLQLWRFVGFFQTLFSFATNRPEGTSLGLPTVLTVGQHTRHLNAGPHPPNNHTINYPGAL
jgi:hypothetical protein